MRTDIGASVPAACTLRVCRRINLHTQALESGFNASGWIRRQIVYTCLGGNQYETQLLAKLCEQRMQLGVDIEIDFGLK